MLKKALKSGARAVARVFEAGLDSNSATIEINGNTMSGKEFKEWRERRKPGAPAMLKREQQRQRAAGVHDDL